MSYFHRDVEINSKGATAHLAACLCRVGLCTGLTWAHHPALLSPPQSLRMPPCHLGLLPGSLPECIARKPALVQLHLYPPYVCFLWWCRKITNDSCQQIKDILKLFCKICTSHLWLLRWSAERRKFVRLVLGSSLCLQGFTIRRCLFLPKTIKEAF